MALRGWEASDVRWGGDKSRSDIHVGHYTGSPGKATAQMTKGALSDRTFGGSRRGFGLTSPIWDFPKIRGALFLGS